MAASRRQGGITKAGNGRARRALIEAAWAYRHPAKVSRAHSAAHRSRCPKPLQDLGWKAQVRLCKRFRRLDRARQASERRRHRDRAGTDRLHVGDREGGAGAGVTHRTPRGRAGAWAPVSAQSSTTLRGDASRPSCLDRGRRSTDHSTVVPNPRISAGSTVGITGPASPSPLAPTFSPGRLRGPLMGGRSARRLRCNSRWLLIIDSIELAGRTASYLTRRSHINAKVHRAGATAPDEPRASVCAGSGATASSAASSPRRQL